MGWNFRLFFLRRAAEKVHRRGQRDLRVRGKLAGLEVLGLGVDLGMAHGLDVLLALQGAVVSGQELILRAVRQRAVLVSQIVLQVDHVSGHVAHGSAANDAQLRTALVAVLKLHRVKRV